MTIKEGTKLGRYEIRSLIGVGGMGEVYRASDPKIGRDVAIKVLPADFSADKERVARFEQEAQAAGALNHPNIIAVYDVDTQDDVLYVVSELLDGEELRERLDEGSIPLRKVTEYAQQIVSGLSAAHEKGIVHRDLKPENLFITKDDRVKILDFGLAKLSEPPASAGGSGQRRCDAKSTHKSRRCHGHGRLYVAGAGSWAEDRSSLGYLFVWLDPVRDDHGPAGISGGIAG